VRLDHYVRTEQRIFCDADTRDVNWSWRSRYRIELPVDLAPSESTPHWRMYLSVEGFLTLGPEQGQRHQQLRGTLGLEHAPADAWHIRFDATVERAARYRQGDTWTALYLRLRVYQRLK
jgi:hypothetical protein